MSAASPIAAPHSSHWLEVCLCNSIGVDFAQFVHRIRRYKSQKCVGALSQPDGLTLTGRANAEKVLRVTQSSHAISGLGRNKRCGRTRWSLGFFKLRDNAPNSVF